MKVEHSLFLMDRHRHEETLHNVYLPCLLYACITLKTTNVRRGVRRKSAFLPSTIPELFGLIYVALKGPRKERERETHTSMCHSLTLGCHWWSAVTQRSHHVHKRISMCTHTLRVATIVHLSVVAIIFNLTPGDQQTILKPSRKQILVVLKPW